LKALPDPNGRKLLQYGRVSPLLYNTTITHPTTHAFSPQPHISRSPKAGCIPVQCIRACSCILSPKSHTVKRTCIAPSPRTPHWRTALPRRSTPPNRNPFPLFSALPSHYLPRFPVASRLAPILSPDTDALITNSWREISPPSTAAVEWS